MKDKYGIELKKGDNVVVNSYNIFSGKDTFDKGTITKLYVVMDKDRPEDTRMELAEIELYSGKIIDAVGKSGIISIQ